MGLHFAFGRWELYLLVLARAAAMIMVAPVLGARPVPAQVKVGLALLLALLLAPLQQPGNVEASQPLDLMILMAREVLVGLLLGFSAALLFSAVQVASRLVGVQVGIGMPSTMDPLAADNASFLDSFYSLFAAIVFLALGGHHAVIAVLARSFDAVPLGKYVPKADAAAQLVGLSAMALEAAVQLALPVIGTVLVIDAATALVVRTMPQMNFFSFGMPVKVAMGLLTLAMLLPWTVAGLGSLFGNLVGAMGRAI